MTELSSVVKPQTSGRRYSAPFKSYAAQNCLASGAVITHVARQLGINHKVFGHWGNWH